MTAIEPLLDEFVYRLPGSPGGHRPGSHHSRSAGAGLAFAGHARLLDHPDPRRLDLRASLATVPREWRVRVHRQRGAVAVHALVDVSASMHVGSPRSRLASVESFLNTLAWSTFRSGDACGLLCYDDGLRDDLYRPARVGRAVGGELAGALAGAAALPARAGDGRGLADAADRLSGAALVFLLSDLHHPLGPVATLLERLGDAVVVPIVMHDASHSLPDATHGWSSLRDAETGRQRHVWLRATTRDRWREAIAQRRKAIDALFAEYGRQAMHVTGDIEPERLSRYFLEHAT